MKAAAWVFGILRDGGYASRLDRAQACFFAVPATLPAAEAATLHCTFGTAYRDLTTLGGLRAGERVLITGANGGVGGAGVQIARRLGAEVIAVIRDARHSDYVRSLGAHEVIVDAGQSFHKRIGRVDLALEAVGHSTFTSSLRSLKIGGRIVVVGNIVPQRVELNLGYLITNGLTIRGGLGANRAEMASLLALHQQVCLFKISLSTRIFVCRSRAPTRRSASGQERRLAGARGPGQFVQVNEVVLH